MGLVYPATLVEMLPMLVKRQHNNVLFKHIAWKRILVFNNLPATENDIARQSDVSKAIMLICSHWYTRSGHEFILIYSGGIYYL